MAKVRRALAVALCRILTAVVIVALPFIVCDLYFGYQQNFCTLIPANDAGISITLSTWLLVYGYFALTMLLLFLMACARVCCNLEAAHLLIWYALLDQLASLFRFCWMIVGAIMFWGYLYPKNLCNDSTGGYMYTRLVLGFVSILWGMISNHR